MLISSTALELAVHQILQRHHIAAGEQVTFDDLHQGWNHTGLRVSDLRDALRGLVDKGCLDCPPGGPDLMFRLTESGQAYFAHFASPTATVNDRHTLAAAEARLATPAAAGPYTRRASDPSAAAAERA